MERCKVCKYKTMNKTHWKIHLETAKHKNNVKKLEENPDMVFECDKCNKQFTRKNNLVRHQTSVCGENAQKEKETQLIKNIIDAEIVKNITDSSILKNAESMLNFTDPHKIINILQETVIKLQTTVKCLTEENKKLNEAHKKLNEEHTNMLKKQVDTLITQYSQFQETQKSSNETVKTSVNALTYLTANFKKAPAIEKLTTETAKSLLSFEKRLSEYLIHHNKKGTMIEYIAGIIIKHIKKEDPENQSVWSSDVSRLTYLIRDLVDDEEKWKTDTNGVKFTKYVITPVVDYIINYMEQYLQEIIKKVTNTQYERDENNSNQKDVLSVIIEIKSKGFTKSILGKIAPHVSFKSNV